MAGVRPLEWLLPQAARRGELDWEAVYREEMPRVFNFLRYRFADRATAEDLTSLTFEKAWRARDRYRRDRARTGTWLLAIARNVARDHFRKKRPEVPIGEGEAASLDSPEAAVLRQDDFARLSALLDELPERNRGLLALKYGAGATNRAIAKLTGLSESNVGTILHRVVTALRSRWEEIGGKP
jgi:RNA polymerase sigma-70 factor (ECF subfamily)